MYHSVMAPDALEGSVYTSPLRILSASASQKAVWQYQNEPLLPTTVSVCQYQGLRDKITTKHKIVQYAASFVAASFLKSRS